MSHEKKHEAPVAQSGSDFFTATPDLDALEALRQSAKDETGDRYTQLMEAHAHRLVAQSRYGRTAFLPSEHLGDHLHTKFVTNYLDNDSLIFFALDKGDCLAYRKEDDGRSSILICGLGARITSNGMTQLLKIHHQKLATFVHDHPDTSLHPHLAIFMSHFAVRTFLHPRAAAELSGAKTREEFATWVVAKVQAYRDGRISPLEGADTQSLRCSDLIGMGTIPIEQLSGMGLSNCAISTALMHNLTLLSGVPSAFVGTHLVYNDSGRSCDHAIQLIQHPNGVMLVDSASPEDDENGNPFLVLLKPESAEKLIAGTPVTMGPPEASRTYTLLVSSVLHAPVNDPNFYSAA